MSQGFVDHSHACCKTDKQTQLLQEQLLSCDVVKMTLQRPATGSAEREVSTVVMNISSMESNINHTKIKIIALGDSPQVYE